MLQTHLMDLVNRDNKATGGYCTYIPGYKSPFIFSNFNGTSADIDVLTHEAGHAFQVWSSTHFPVEEYYWPTSDAAEIHSMSMEFFTWPWMHLFFGEQKEKYQFMHLAAALQFIPYGVAVDEFQHIVYENPDMTPGERNAAWRELEKHTCHTEITREMNTCLPVNSGNDRVTYLIRLSTTLTTPWHRFVRFSSGRRTVKIISRPGRIIFGSVRQAGAGHSWSWSDWQICVHRLKTDAWRA